VFSLSTLSVVSLHEMLNPRQLWRAATQEHHKTELEPKQREEDVHQKGGLQGHFQTLGSCLMKFSALEVAAQCSRETTST
jgi:hypothetical protein